MNTAYSHALRAIICPECGDVVHGPPAGGEARCELCEAKVTLAPRDNMNMAAGLTQLAEPERLERLDTQDHEPPEPPASIQHLLDDGALIAERATEALQLWQAARRRLGQGDVAAEDEFYALTVLLHDHMSGQRDDLQLRALLETATEIIPTPDYRQVFYGYLAREAALVGDLSAADDWVGLCDPRAVDLRADSAYRFSAAYVATTRRQFERALEVLGPTGHGVPVTVDLDPACFVLRANAYERLGRVDDAIEELASGMGRVKNGAELSERLIRRHGSLNLCHKSLRRARNRVETPTEEVREPSKHLRVGRAFRVALPWLVASLLFLTLWATTDPESVTLTGQRLDVFFLVVAVSLCLPAAIVFWRRWQRKHDHGQAGAVAEEAAKRSPKPPPSESR